MKLRAVDGIKEVPKENVVTRERQRLAAAENPKPTRRYVMDELLKYFWSNRSLQCTSKIYVGMRRISETVKRGFLLYRLSYITKREDQIRTDDRKGSNRLMHYRIECSRKEEPRISKSDKDLKGWCNKTAFKDRVINSKNGDWSIWLLHFGSYDLKIWSWIRWIRSRFIWWWKGDQKWMKGDDLSLVSKVIKSPQSQGDHLY